MCRISCRSENLVSTSDPGSSAVATHPDLALGRSTPITDNRAAPVFGQVMGLVAVTIGFLAVGAYVDRDLNAGLGIVFFIGAFACIFALNVACPRDSRQLATTLLFGVGLLLGLALGPVLSAYAKADSSALWQAAGATAAFVAALGALGYAVRRDLTAWARTLFWALVALIVFAIVAIFASIPHANLIYAVAGLATFGGFTMFDFNGVLRTGTEGAVPIAASIFLDIFNVFRLLLQLFGGER